jgi:hypothetical protein
VPALPLSWRSVAILRLLNHTSGIPSFSDLDESWRNRWGEELTRAQLAALTADKPFVFPADTSWKYGNTGRIARQLGRTACGKAMGRPVRRPSVQAIWTGHTNDCATAAIIPGPAEGYSLGANHERVNTPFLAMSQPQGAGAKCSSIGDLPASASCVVRSARTRCSRTVMASTAS